MAAPQSEEMKTEEKSERFYERLVALPAVIEAIDQTVTVYNTVKNTTALTQCAFNAGENVVKKVSETACNVGTPIADIALKVAEPYVGNPVESIDQAAVGVLAKCEEKFPIITESPNKILSTTVDTIKEKATECYRAVNDTYLAKFTNARIDEALSLSELAVEVLLPADPTIDEDVEEEAKESLAIQKKQEDVEPKGHIERVLSLGKRIQRRGSRKISGSTTVQFTYESVVSIQEKMSTLIHRSQEMGKTVQHVVLVLPSLAIRLTGEAVCSTKDSVIAFTNTYSLKDIPGSVATAGEKVIEPVTNATGQIIGQLLLPPRMLAEYILSSRPIQCLIPNIVIFEEIKTMEIEADELADDSDNDDMEDGFGEEEPIN